MKWLLLIGAALAFLMALAAIVGAWLPREHVATRSATYRRRPVELYAVVRDWAKMPLWRTGVQSVELLPAKGRPGYREITRHGTVPYVVLEDRPGDRLVMQIADDQLP